jgi:uncharacterized protein (TIGR03066 family)
MLRICTAVAFVVVFVVNAPADDKPTKIVGTWEITKTDRLASGGSFVIQFRKDGTATSQAGPPKMKTTQGHTWKLDGDKLTVLSKADAVFKFESGTITVLTDKKMIVKLKDGVEEEYTSLK